MSVQVLFAHLDPSLHPDFNRDWLGVVDFWSGYDGLAEQMMMLDGYEREKKTHAKAVL